MSKLEEFYRALIKDPDLEIKAGQTREQAAQQEAEYRARQYNNNVQALALANEPAQVESPINALFNHLEQMKKSMPDTALIKGLEDIQEETRVAIENNISTTKNDITESNELIESNNKTLEEKKVRLEELNTKNELSEKELKEQNIIPNEINDLENTNQKAQEKLQVSEQNLRDIGANIKRIYNLTDEDVDTLTGPPTQEETTPEPEQPEVTPEQSPDTPPAASKINPRTAAAAKEHLGEERYNELLENGDLEGKNIADIRQEFPKPDAEEPKTTTAEEEPKTETEEPAAEPEQPEAEAPQAETPAETPEPEPQASTPEMDNLIDTAKQNQKDENGEDIEGSSLFDHLYNQTHGNNPFGDTKEEFEQSLRAQNPTKLKTKFRTEYTKLQTSREREQEQKEIKRQAQQKQEGNTLPHDESDFKDISENDATQLATEIVAHNQKYKHTLSPASKKKLDKILEAAKKAGADLEKIAEDKEKLGDKFGSEEHYKDLAEHHAEKEKQATLERHSTGDDDEAKQARRRAGIEASQSAKDFHHGDDLNTKSRMSQSKEGTAENFGHSRHKKTTGAPASSNMPPAMREIMEEQNKDKPNKELIRENKAFLAQKASEGYKWHPDTKHWVHEEGLNSLLGSHKGNAGTLLDGQHQVKGHPPTLLNGDGSTSNKKVLYSQGGLQNFGGDSITGKALEHSFKNGSFKSQNAATSALGKGGIKLNDVSSHTNFAGITTPATNKPTLRTAMREGYAQGQQDRERIKAAAGSALGRIKTSFLDRFMSKAEQPFSYPTAIELLSKSYYISKNKKSIKNSSIIKV
mgnify:CR=1 FL=1